jgi:hypothetical protein
MTDATADGAGASPALTTGRTTLATVTLAALAISVVGLVVSAIGHMADWKGFDNGGESTVAGSTFWMMYFLAGIAALVLGLVALIKSWRNGPASEQRAGRLALGYVVLSVIFLIIID